MKSFLDGYIDSVKQTLDQLDQSEIEAAIELVRKAYEDDRLVLVCGNGGSASTASHFVNDLNKGILGHKGDKKIRRFRGIALNDNVSLMTAWANDVGYDCVFSEQVKNYMREDDILIVFSSSGNSPNIVKAAQTAQQLGGKVVSLTGFSGGKVKDHSDVHVYIPVDSYQVSEDVHLSLVHMITQHFFETLSEEREHQAVKSSPESQKLEQQGVTS